MRREDTMRSIRIGLAVLWAATALNAAACEQKGPAERAGEKIDKAAEKGADAVETAGSKVKDAVDKCRIAFSGVAMLDTHPSPSEPSLVDPVVRVLEAGQRVVRSRRAGA